MIYIYIYIYIYHNDTGHNDTDVYGRAPKPPLT